MSDLNNYKYELKYTYNDKVCSVSFNGEITFDQLVSNLQDFLYSCGWSEDTVKRQIKTEDDMWEESEVEQDKEEDLSEEVEQEQDKNDFYQDCNYNITYTDNNYDTYCRGYNTTYNYYNNGEYNTNS